MFQDFQDKFSDCVRGQCVENETALKSLQLLQKYKTTYQIIVIVVVFYYIILKFYAKNVKQLLLDAIFFCFFFMYWFLTSFYIK